MQERLSESAAQLVFKRRRAKAALLSEDLPALEKQVKKGKKLTPEVLNDRASKVVPLAILQAIGYSDQMRSCRPVKQAYEQAHEHHKPKGHCFRLLRCPRPPDLRAGRHLQLLLVPEPLSKAAERTCWPGTVCQYQGAGTSSTNGVRANE